MEIKHLRRNVQSLRDELENKKLRKKPRFKKRWSMPTLKSTIYAVMFNPYVTSWKKKIAEETKVQQAVVNADIEIKHLRRNVQSLRDELEKQKIAEETKVQKPLPIIILKSHT